MVLDKEKAYQIIDEIKERAYKYTDAYYTDAVKEIGDNKDFKSKLDSMLDNIIIIKLESHRKYLNERFELAYTIEAKDLMRYLNIETKFYTPARHAGNTTFSIALLIADESINKAYAEVMCEVLSKM